MRCRETFLQSHKQQQKKKGLIVTVFEPLLHQASHRQIKDLLVTSIAGKHNNQTEKNKIKNYSLHEI